ncbi:MAG: acyltransferase [Oscillospiraceae bacterium]|nr:acyltransferase [Oscillospiraceae bacterium]
MHNKINVIRELSKNDTSMLKGIFAIAVLVHHLYQHSKLFYGTPIGSILQLLGFLSVSVFFFLSGYGLTVSYNNKGDKYIKDFPGNKLLPFYFYMTILIIIYSLENLILGIPMDFSALIQSFLFGKTVINNGWYLQTTLFLYLIFYFALAFVKKDFLKKYAFFAGFAIYFFVCFFLDLSSYWYETVLAFAAGSVFACLFQKNKIFEIRPFFAVIFTGILFIISTLLGHIDFIPAFFGLIFRMFSNISFAVLVVLITITVPVRFAFFEKIGSISFEIYVSQGLFLSLFHSNIIYVENQILYIFLTSISTFAFSVPLHSFFSKSTVFLKKSQLKK